MASEESPIREPSHMTLPVYVAPFRLAGPRRPKLAERELLTRRDWKLHPSLQN
jgi:hypothetical protein